LLRYLPKNIYPLVVIPLLERAKVAEAAFLKKVIMDSINSGDITRPRAMILPRIIG
jgi:hypothetical protein